MAINNPNNIGDLLLKQFNQLWIEEFKKLRNPILGRFTILWEDDKWEFIRFSSKIKLRHKLQRDVYTLEQAKRYTRLVPSYIRDKIPFFELHQNLS